MPFLPVCFLATPRAGTPGFFNSMATSGRQLRKPSRSGRQGFKVWLKAARGSHSHLFGSVGPLRKGIAPEFTIISHEDVPIGKGGGRPGEFLFKQRRRGFNQMSAAELTISGRREFRPNQVPSIGK